MRRPSWWLALSFVVAGLAAPALAVAQPEGTGTMSNEGFAGEPPKGVRCPEEPGEAADEECREYWETHINWFSTDYKKTPDQRPDHRHMPPPLGMALINFLIFAGIMYRLAAKPLQEYVRTRHITIKNELGEAARLREAAAAKLKEYEAKVAGIDQEVDRLVAGIRGDAEAEKARLQASAEREAVRIQKDAEAQMQSEMARVRRELRKEIVDAALAAAEKILQQKVGPDDQRKLVDRYLNNLESGTAGGAPSSSGRS